MSGLIEEIGNRKDYLSDESRRIGVAADISFPVCAEEIREILTRKYQGAIPVTIQGARTGITGGASPISGHILNLSQMNQITGISYDHKKGYSLLVQPGVLLFQLRNALNDYKIDSRLWSEESKKVLEQLKKSKQSLFFPPDPTETTASIGGMVACNASGACSFNYGPTRKYIQGLQVILIDGSMLQLKRGEQQANKGDFILLTKEGKTIQAKLPHYQLPAVKNAAGYYLKPEMDLLDLFIGSEGTLGVISEIEIRLIPAPDLVWGVMLFFYNEIEALRFVKIVRSGDDRPVAIEFFNYRSLQLLREQRDILTVGIPDINHDYQSAIYLEYHGDTRDSIIGQAKKMTEILEKVGGDSENSWLANTPQELKRLKEFRHAVPEAINHMISERKREEAALTKLGTDMAVPDCYLEDIMDLYNKTLKQTGLDSAIFGHIGDNHLHVNIIPDSLAEFKRGKEIYYNWAKAVVNMGGTISAEHGVGKLKVPFLEKMYGEKALEKMLSVKKLFDSRLLLNRGNLFAERWY